MVYRYTAVPRVAFFNKVGHYFSPAYNVNLQISCPFPKIVKGWGLMVKVLRVSDLGSRFKASGIRVND